MIKLDFIHHNITTYHYIPNTMPSQSSNSNNGSFIRRRLKTPPPRTAKRRTAASSPRTPSNHVSKPSRTVSSSSQKLKSKASAISRIADSAGDMIATINQDLDMLYKLIGTFTLVGSAAVMIYCMAYGSAEIQRDCQQYRVDDYDLVFDKPGKVAKGLSRLIKSGSVRVKDFTYNTDGKLEDNTERLRQRLTNTKGTKVYITSADGRLIELDMIHDRGSDNKRVAYNLSSERTIHLDGFQHLYNTYSAAFDNNNVVGLNNVVKNSKRRRHTQKQRIVRQLHDRVPTGKNNNGNDGNNTNNGRPPAKRATAAASRLGSSRLSGM